METVNPETVRGNMVAIPNNLTELDGDGKEREVLAIINDSNLGEPFTLYSSPNAWWNDVQKVEKLMFCFKNDMTVQEACFSVGIPVRTFYYFTQIHPEFLHIKEQLSKALPAMAKLTLAKGLEKDAGLSLRYLQGVQPETYRRSVLPEMPGAKGSYARKTEELFMDEAGNVVVSRKTAMLLESYGGTSTDTEGEGE